MLIGNVMLCFRARNCLNCFRRPSNGLERILYIGMLSSFNLDFNLNPWYYPVVYTVGIQFTWFSCFVVNISSGAVREKVMFDRTQFSRK